MDGYEPWQGTKGHWWFHANRIGVPAKDSLPPAVYINLPAGTSENHLGSCYPTRQAALQALAVAMHRAGQPTREG